MSSAKEYTTPVFTGTPPEVTTEVLADMVADVVSKKASTASAGGGIAGAAVGTLGLQFLPKLWGPAKKKFKEVKDWKRVHEIVIFLIKNNLHIFYKPHCDQSRKTLLFGH